MILAIHREIKAKFYTVPIDYNGFRSFVYSNSRNLTREVDSSILKHVKHLKPVDCLYVTCRSEVRKVLRWLQ